MKRYGITVILVAIVMGVLDAVLHGIVLNGLYEMTGALWRSMAEVRAMSWLMVAGYLVFALIFVAIYRKGYEKDKSGAGQGLRYGFWIGLLLGTTGSIGCYILMPVPLALAIGWFLGTMVECLITGWITGIVYKP